MSTTSNPAAPAALSSLGPGIVAAATFACADVLVKVVFAAGADTLTQLSFRSVVGLACFAVWLRVGARPAPLAPRERWVALGVGLLFAVTVYCVFEAIKRMDVPTAILAYFVYPLITGLVAGVTGLERLGWRGLAAALVAFLGLGLMIGAHPGELAVVGVAFSFAGAISRAALLLVTRALLAKSDARLLTWYSMLSSTTAFVAVSAAARTWHPPHGAVGWTALATTSVVTIVAILATFISTSRVGPFRTALVMNLEPLLTTIGSALFLGEVLTPVQALGGAIMLAALAAFQLRR